MHRERPRARYSFIIGAGILLIVVALLLYLISTPNPANPSPTVLAEYYAAVGGGGGLLLAGITSYEVHSWGLYLEQVIKEQNQTKPPNAGQT
jgi:4-amino-4-deoxy-L-arabinose transferase-like glycosyltransferase